MYDDRPIFSFYAVATIPFTVIAIGTILKNHVDQHDLGEVLMDVDTIFGEHDVRRPDLFYFTKARRRFIGEKAIEGLEVNEERLDAMARRNPILATPARPTARRSAAGRREASGTARSASTPPRT